MQKQRKSYCEVPSANNLTVCLFVKKWQTEWMNKKNKETLKNNYTVASAENETTDKQDDM